MSYMSTIPLDKEVRITVVDDRSQPYSTEWQSISTLPSNGAVRITEWQSISTFPSDDKVRITGTVGDDRNQPYSPEWQSIPTFSSDDKVRITGTVVEDPNQPYSPEWQSIPTFSSDDKVRITGTVVEDPNQSYSPELKSIPTFPSDDKIRITGTVVENPNQPYSPEWQSIPTFQSDDKIRITGTVGDDRNQPHSTEWQSISTFPSDGAVRITGTVVEDLNQPYSSEWQSIPTFPSDGAVRIKGTVVEDPNQPYSPEWKSIPTFTSDDKIRITGTVVEDPNQPYSPEWQSIPTFPSDDKVRITGTVGDDPNQPYSKGSQNSSGPQKTLRMRTNGMNYYDIRDMCLNEGALLVDDDFDAVGKHEWKRPKDILRGSATPRFYVDGPRRFDIKQNNLGDCWMLAPMCCLSMRHDLLKKVVPSGQDFEDGNYAGIFRFNLWDNGAWVEVIIDDRLPANDQGLVYTSSSHRDEFWTALLEKAIAKLYGSYENLQIGFANKALVNFTGGTAEVLKTKDSSDLWDIMLTARERGSLMCCTTADSTSIPKETHLPNGLVATHTYSVTRVIPLKAQTFGNLRMVRVRNPWGSDDMKWIGVWGDESPNWNEISDLQKREIGFKADETDGEFWMSFDEFVESFDELHMCHCVP